MVVTWIPASIHMNFASDSHSGDAGPPAWPATHFIVVTSLTIYSLITLKLWSHAIVVVSFCCKILLFCCRDCSDELCNINEKSPALTPSNYSSSLLRFRRKLSETNYCLGKQVAVQGRVAVECTYGDDHTGAGSGPAPLLLLLLLLRVGVPVAAQHATRPARTQTLGGGDGHQAAQVLQAHVS